jgi:ubiquinone biosynthesis protein
MDLRMEAAAASELRDNFLDDETYGVPRVDWQRTSTRVLTLERISGIPIDDRDALIAAGHDLEEVLTKAAEIFFNQVFRDGFFHGDQHAGNMAIDQSGRIVAVDFGIMGRLDRGTRFYLADMLTATLSRDYLRLAEVHVRAGYLPAGQPLETFAQALRSVCEPIVGRSLNEISFARLLAQLLQVTESFHMPVQPQLLLLQKNMMMAEGVSRRLSPDLNIWILAQPLIEEWMHDNLGPEARVRDAAGELRQAAERLPGLVAGADQIARDLASGGLRVHPDSLQALSGRGDGLGRWALWIAVAALVIALIAAL